MMRNAWGGLVAVGLGGLGALLGTPGSARAQAVAFAPTVATIPDGVSLNAVPAVSADRRYVRLSVNANFTTVNGIQNFPIPFAVSGLNSGGGAGGGAGAAAGLLGTPMGMNGPAGSGPGTSGAMTASGMPPMNSPQAWAGSAPFDGSYADDDWSWSPPARRPKATRAKSARSNKPAPKSSTSAPRPQPR